MLRATIPTAEETELARLETAAAIAADPREQQAVRLRALAAWYREYAEATDNPTIWNFRLSTAEELERQAAELMKPKADRGR